MRGTVQWHRRVYRALSRVLDTLLKIGWGAELSIELVIQLHAGQQSLVNSVCNLTEGVARQKGLDEVSVCTEGAASHIDCVEDIV